MKNILFVSAGALPLPPVKGGAVECLIDYLLVENDRKGKYHFIVASIWDDQARKKAREYSNTEFLFIKPNKLYYNLALFLSKVIYKFTRKSVHLEAKYYGKCVKKVAKKWENNNENQFDYIVIENNESLVGTLSSLKRPIALHLHNNYLNAGMKNAYKILEKCHSIIAVSEFIARKVYSIHGAEGKTHVLLNCTETERFQRELYIDFRREFRASYGLADSDIVFVFAGRIHPTKGVKELLQAFNKIDREDIKLLILGGDWYSSNNTTPYIKEVKKLMKIKEGQIIWTGYVDYEDMPKYYAVADAAVFPSVWEEPSSLVVLEMEAAGLPLIASYVGGVPENSSVDTTLYVEVNDREKMVNQIREYMLRLSDDSVLRQKLGEQGIQYTRNRNTERYYLDFCKLIERLKK